MRVKFSRNAVKFLDKIAERNKSRLRLKIKELTLTIEEESKIPFRELDIRKLTGDWMGFYRMRIGKIRVIFKIDENKETLLIHEIDFRGDIYKRK